MFQVNDVVHLRQRPLVRPSTPTPPARPTLVVAIESPPLTVISPTRPLAPDELQVRLQTGTLNVGDFSATGLRAPILFNPRPASTAAAAAGDRYAEMMAQFIRAHITTSGRPLNASPTPPAYAVRLLPRQASGSRLRSVQSIYPRRLRFPVDACRHFPLILLARLKVAQPSTATYFIR